MKRIVVNNTQVAYIPDWLPLYNKFGNPILGKNLKIGDILDGGLEITECADVPTAFSGDIRKVIIAALQACYNGSGVPAHTRHLIMEDNIHYELDENFELNTDNDGVQRVYRLREGDVIQGKMIKMIIDHKVTDQVWESKKYVIRNLSYNAYFHKESTAWVDRDKATLYSSKKFAEDTIKDNYWKDCVVEEHVKISYVIYDPDTRQYGKCDKNGKWSETSDLKEAERFIDEDTAKRAIKNWFPKRCYPQEIRDVIT